MNPTLPDHALQLNSLVTRAGMLEISLDHVPVPDPGPDEVLVRIEAAPINPSDQGLLFAAADPRAVQLVGTASRPLAQAPLPPSALAGLAGRIDQPMPVGNEGAGTVVRCGTSAAAQALLGRTVAVLGGAMYAQYRCLPVQQCLVLPQGTTSAEGASAFVNPLTALGMVETLRREGHTALVHTAAASNLGQMLLRICRHDGVPLVNIVRKPEQRELLLAQGAVHVCVSSAPTFTTDLIDALAATGATLAFDATGGGPLAGQILNAMEAALARRVTGYSRYGSTTHKQVYIYGGLDSRPTELTRQFGMAWSLGGWLLFPFLQKLDPADVQTLKLRVAAEIKSTFASHYAGTLSLRQALVPAFIARYAQRATATKYLIEPQRDL